MKPLDSRSFRIALATLVGVGTFSISDEALLMRSASLVTTADARIGRPLTPMSYAGVARRTTRRAVAAGAAAGAVYGPRCVQAVDAYGRVYTRC
jgi:hypothetical protein